MACKGDDYGTVGNEVLIPTERGRAYGIETMLRWQVPDNLILQLHSRYFVVNSVISPLRGIIVLSSTSVAPTICLAVGALEANSVIGGAPYTPYDEDKSSLVEAWNAQGRPYYDYLKYNTERLPNFAQFDVRIDKSFYFHRCMAGFYIDIQNITGSKLKQQDVIMSTGVIEILLLPLDNKYIK
ncbi:MAG: hypothetical protein V8S11_06035 [Flavonifractor plautii]